MKGKRWEDIQREEGVNIRQEKFILYTTTIWYQELYSRPPSRDIDSHCIVTIKETTPKITHRNFSTNTTAPLTEPKYCAR